MQRIAQIASAVAMGIALAAPAARAQATFGIDGGVAIPMGDLADGVKTGYTVGGQLGFRPASFPFGMRADVSYTAFKFDGADYTAKLTGGALSALFTMPGPGTRPYLIVGPGFYHRSSDVPESGNQNKFAVQGGVGVNFPLSGISSALEAQVVNVFTDPNSSQFATVTFAIKFGGPNSNDGM